MDICIVRINLEKLAKLASKYDIKQHSDAT